MTASAAPPRSSRRAARRRQRRNANQRAQSIDRIILVAAGLGLLVSTYLTLVDLLGTGTLCPAGSDCDTVRGSSFGHVFGLPVAMLGVAYFATTLYLVLTRRQRDGLLLQVAGGLGLGSALVFLWVQGSVLGAWCPYCLVADGAALAVGARTLLPWSGRAVLRTVAGVAIAVVVLVVGYAAGPVQPATTDDQLVALADHLRESGAVMYGAYWCPHCQNQKQMFGPAASHLPYVECDPNGANARPDLCQAAGVRAYPTWVINGHRLEGEVSVDELARLSGFSP